jgi:RNA polymerase sigma factor (sigma-70 family)
MPGARVIFSGRPAEFCPVSAAAGRLPVNPMPSDSDLLRRFANEADEFAFAELVQRHLGVVYNAALRRANGNFHLAEEAAQIVFTQLACKAHALRDHAALLGWLHTSTHYATSVLIRRELRQAVRRDVAAAMIRETSEPRDVEWDTLRPLIDEALDRLNADDRQAVLLRYFSGRSFGELGAELGISDEASRKRVDRALERLRRLFARRGVKTTAGALAIALSRAPAFATPAALAGTITEVAKTVAMASAIGATTSTGVGLFATVKTSSVALAACTVIGIATLGIIIVKWSEQRDTARQIEVMRTEATAIKGRLTVLAKAEMNARPATPAAKQTANGSTSGGFSPNLQEQLDGNRKLLESAEYTPFREQMIRLQVQHEFGAFLVGHDLTGEKARLIREAIARYYDAEEKLSMELHRDSSNLSAVEALRIKKAVEQAKQKITDDLRPILDDSELAGINQCFAAQKTLPAAKEVSWELAYANAPMDRVQELALATVLVNADGANSAASPEQRIQRNAVDPNTGLSARDRALLDDAAVFLNPAQVALYEQYLRHDHMLADLKTRAAREVDAGQPHS